MRARLPFGLRAATQGRAASQHPAAQPWEREAVEAAATDAAEAAFAGRTQLRGEIVLLGLLGVVAGLLAAVFPLTPGFSAADTTAAVVAAAVTAAASVVLVLSADRFGRARPGTGAGDLFVFGAALASAGAATIHLAVAKTHFDEYALFGLFFVGAAIAQLVWPVWLLLRRWPPLLVLGAAGNALIAALWAVDRIWGLPLGPTRWKPDPVGFGDSVSSSFELLLAAACITVLVRGRGAALRARAMLTLTLGVAVLTTLSLLSVIGIGSSFLTPTK